MNLIKRLCLKQTFAYNVCLVYICQSSNALEFTVVELQMYDSSLVKGCHGHGSRPGSSF